MDQFQVPKKVNRHVLKAIHFLTSENEPATISQIINQVKYQMKKLVPVENIEIVIQKSLTNLSNIGVINRSGLMRFSMGASIVPLPRSTLDIPRPNKKINRLGKRSTSNLDPNTNRRAQYDTEEYFSDDDYDRPPKRLRTNDKKLNFAGRGKKLTKSRQYQHKRFVSRNSLENEHFENCRDISIMFPSTDILNKPLQITEATGHNVAEMFNNSKSFDNNVCTRCSIPLEKTDILCSEPKNDFIQEAPIVAELN